MPKLLKHKLVEERALEAENVIVPRVSKHFISALNDFLSDDSNIVHIAHTVANNVVEDIIEMAHTNNTNNEIDRRIKTNVGIESAIDAIETNADQIIDDCFDPQTLRSELDQQVSAIIFEMIDATISKIRERTAPTKRRSPYEIE